ncbi:MAG: ABC transporter substrate-binding protein [Steroidobacteraceae bacterium]
MRTLTLSIATGNYDRVRPLMDGQVRIEGVDPLYMLLEPEEIFFRAFRGAQFDVCELSLSSLAVQTARGESPYVGVPVFPSRMFRHGAIFVRTDRAIRSAADLRGRRVGLPEYQLTACVWARILLEEDHGVAPHEILWVRGGLEQGGREEKIPLDLPRSVSLEDAPADRTLAMMLAAGELDGLVTPRVPSLIERGHPSIGRLFPDPAAAARSYFERTKIFPIMHVLGVRRSLASEHPWLPGALLKAFTEAKTRAIAALADSASAKVSLPFVDEDLNAARALMGHDYWSYGVESNRHVLDTFLRHHHAQGLSARRLAPEELFHPTTLEQFKI